LKSPCNSGSTKLCRSPSWSLLMACTGK
jgi:hypothetical protein